MMFLFIFESLGTSELILIGIVALIVFGPRKLPELARTIGKTMADFRKTTNEFKETWEKEVDLEKITEMEPPKTISKSSPEPLSFQEGVVAPPVIRNIDDASIADHFSPENREESAEEITSAAESENSDKKNWI